MEDFFVIFVEGFDDKLFFEKLRKKLCLPENTLFYEYACKKNDNIRAYLRSLDTIPNASYLFTADLDIHGDTVETAIEAISNKFGASPEKIQIVVKEVEGWYLAGLEGYRLGEKSLKHNGSTDQIDKEAFNYIIEPVLKSSISRTDILIRILNQYSIDAARNNNTSFKHFHTTQSMR